MTGAAFGPKESREYASVNPTGGKSLDLNLSVINGALNQLQNRVEGTVRAKVPQADDILKLANIPKTEEEAKTRINSIYKTSDETVRSTIDTLFGNEYTDSKVFEYLQIKGLIK
jgi:hypothetical protein